MSNKVVLAVKHTAGKGKSESLRGAANYLLRRYPNFSPVEGAPDAVPASGDFWLIVKINQKVIAIESKNDPDVGLAERLDELAINFQADIILCSTRTKSSTVEAVKGLKDKYGFELMWSSTYEVEPSRQAEANNFKGQHLINLLQSFKLI